jgi:hypothetical protein
MGGDRGGDVSPRDVSPRDVSPPDVSPPDVSAPDVSPLTCPRCGAESEGGNFCTRCGQDLQPDRAVVTPDPRPVDVRPELRTCDACGAPNAISRRWCARCRAPLDEDVAVAESPADPELARDAGDPGPVGPQSETPAALVLVTLLAGLVVLGVVLTLLNARGIGWFAGPEPEPVPGAPVEIAVVAVRASSSLPSSGDVTYGPENLIDGDPTSAWNEAASGAGVGEWVELILERTVPVTRLLIWNGYQKGAQFEDNARVAVVDIDLGDRTLTAELLDVRGPQAVDLPDPIAADRIRLTIRRVHEGERYGDAAISEIEVYGVYDTPASPIP